MNDGASEGRKAKAPHLPLAFSWLIMLLGRPRPLRGAGRRRTFFLTFALQEKERAGRVGGVRGPRRAKGWEGEGGRGDTPIRETDRQSRKKGHQSGKQPSKTQSGKRETRIREFARPTRENLGKVYFEGFGLVVRFPLRLRGRSRRIGGGGGGAFGSDVHTLLT